MQNKEAEIERKENQKTKTVQDQNKNEILANFFQDLLSKKKEINIQQNQEVKQEMQNKETEVEREGNQKTKTVQDQNENEILANFFQDLLSKKKEINVQQYQIDVKQEMQNKETEVEREETQKTKTVQDQNKNEILANFFQDLLSKKKEKLERKENQNKIESE
ncbi:hypothetical protein GLOIN_2v1704749 [Rhizophagus irregularis DAOM 181602=DAOM 197198]|nr:hypothetical protein GLOIN_2v1704749 [Rhizophagus irregularis DAOM 181602=DAOM 197198]